MSLAATIQFILDVVFLGAVYFAFLYIKNEIKFRKEFEQTREEQNRLSQEWTDRLKDLNELKDSLELLVTEALKVSDKINKGVEVKKNETADLLDRIEEEKKALSLSMEELNMVAAELKKRPEARKILGDGDRYADALMLAKKGFSAEEISQKTKMPLGEIELALSLRKGDD
jgi:hypothetical protein